MNSNDEKGMKRSRIKITWKGLKGGNRFFLSRLPFLAQKKTFPFGVLKLCATVCILMYIIGLDSLSRQ